MMKSLPKDGRAHELCSNGQMADAEESVWPRVCVAQVSAYRVLILHRSSN